MSTTQIFDTGATRNSDTDKYDYEGFLSPLVIERFGQYMHKNRHLADGSMRASDNWQLGIPLRKYIKSKMRHDHDMWMLHRGYKCREESIEEACCAIIFNTQGYLHELLKAKSEAVPQ